MELHLTEEQAKALHLLLADKLNYDEDGEIQDDTFGNLELQMLRGASLSELPNLWISVYTCCTCYGGPEEGGWTYEEETLSYSAAHSDFADIADEYNRQVTSCIIRLGQVAVSQSHLYISPAEAKDYYEGKTAAPHIYMNDPRNPNFPGYIITLERERGSLQTWRKPIYC